MNGPADALVRMRINRRVKTEANGAWMRSELEKGEVNGRLSCPNERCGAAVGRYDWKGIRCACGGWVTPGLSLQRARVDEEVRRRPGTSSEHGGAGAGAMGV
jgi:dual specificity phosphatase 12